MGVLGVLLRARATHDRVVFVLRPTSRIAVHVQSNSCHRRFVSNQAFVVVALPESSAEWRPEAASDAANVRDSRKRFEGAHDHSKTAPGAPCFRTAPRRAGTLVVCAFSRGESDDAVDVVRHHHEAVECDVCKPVLQRTPDTGHHLPRRFQPDAILRRFPEQAAPVLHHDRDEARARARVVESAKAQRSPVMGKHRAAAIGGTGRSTWLRRRCHRPRQDVKDVPDPFGSGRTQ